MCSVDKFSQQSTLKMLLHFVIIIGGFLAPIKDTAFCKKIFWPETNADTNAPVIFQ